MTREIKFRAWDKVNETMTPDYRTRGHKTLNDVFWEDDGFVFMQYTGLKDKNGHEIYEGDIVTTDYNKEHNLPGKVVEYVDASDDLETGMIGFAFYVRDVSKNGEVIGNIYENPELLEQSK